MLVYQDLTENRLGYQVNGLKHSDISDGAVREKLFSMWLERGLIVFRDVDVTGEFHVDLSRIFGELVTTSVVEMRADDNPNIMRFISNRETETVTEIDGKEYIAWLPWHFDTVWQEKINRGGVLRAIKIASSGGQTGFIDRAAAYDDLPEDLKDEITGLNGVFRMHVDLETSPYTQKVKVVQHGKAERGIQSRIEKDYPYIVHPLVFVHPENGRTVLNYSPFFAMYVEGYSSEASERLFNRLSEYIYSRPAYYHSWKPTDMVVWDNWRMLHCVTGAPADETRVVERTTIKGDLKLGRALERA